MTIMTAIQKGNYVQVYDEKRHLLFVRPGELVGFTPNSVSIKRGSYVYVYNEKGGLRNTF